MYKLVATGAVLLAVVAAIYSQRLDYSPPAGESAEAEKNLEEKIAVTEEVPVSTAPRGEKVPGKAPPQKSRGGEMPILGQKVRLREIRRGEELVNLEFVIRQGILPRRLFADGERRILRYDELHHNNVGYGASTVWLLYQLQSGRSVDLAVSRPDGSDFQVLARDLEEVLGFEHLPVENRLRLELREGGSRVVRDYALPSS